MKYRNLVIAFLFLCFTLACYVTPTVDGHIPEEGKDGLRSIKEVGYFNISEYMDIDLDQFIYYVGIFSGTAEDGRIHIRGWLIRNEKGQPLREAYLGEFTHQFDDLPVQTLMFETNGTRFVTGYVEPQVPGMLVDIIFDRYRPPGDKTEWFNARKTTNIKKGAYFVFPILTEEMGVWEKIKFVGVRTDESLQRGTSRLLDFYEVHISYNPPKYIGDLFLPDPFADEGE